MNAMTNLKRNINSARARWNSAPHALNCGSKMDHTNLVRASRVLSEFCSAQFQPQPQPQRGGGCNVSLQPGFLGTAYGQ
jgi:hypothetical protein